jgi:hypothetical protein
MWSSYELQDSENKTLRYSTHCPFTGVTLLKTPEMGKTAVREVKALWKKCGSGI